MCEHVALICKLSRMAEEQLQPAQLFAVKVCALISFYGTARQAQSGLRR